MDNVWVLCALFEHEIYPTRIEQYTGVLFVSQEIAEQHLNGEYGDEIAATAGQDARHDPTLSGYWLDDIVVCSVPLSVITDLYA